MEYMINTPCGPVQGSAGRVTGVAAYKGIRYAVAGRWEYPKPVTGWEGIYDATAYGHCSYQPRAFYNEADVPEKAFYYNEFRKGERYSYSEDCLFLNVFTPDTAKEGDRLPVLVYIHGGGFTGGCGHEKHFDCPIWPAKGVIGVTVNYRLGPLGFACLPELKQEAGITGNYGLYDQLAALKWVKNNISAFGGDPENTTIMGQSAGAMSVQQHALSPLTEGLFHKAVMSSGGGVTKMISPALPEKSYDFWHAVMEQAGCLTLNQFRELPAQELFAAWQAVKKNQMMGEYNHTMDTKGRLIVPAKFREAGGDRFVVTKGLEKCLFLFTEEKWDSVVESISHMPLTHKNARAFSRFFIGSAGECDVDKQGRILIPGVLREYAGLEKDVVLVGVLSRIEIWDKHKWEESNTYDDMDEIAEHMADLGLSI